MESTDQTEQRDPARAPAGGVPSTRRRIAVAARRPFASRPWTFEVAIFALALLVYQGSRALVVGDPSTAFENAAGIIDWEKSTGLFVEPSIQHWILGHVHLIEALNYFYMYAHWTVTPLFFIWLYRRRKRVYPYVRNAFLATNGMALVVFMLYPVAPPRLAGAGEGFVDTLHNISDIDLHGGVFSGWFNPHAAVPSMHFGYALMIGMVGLVLLRSWPLRALAAVYPVAVFITITATANHYVIDAVAGGLAVAIGFVGVWGWMAARGGLRPRAAAAGARAGTLHRV